MSLRYKQAPEGQPPVATEQIGEDHYQHIKLIDPTPGSVAAIGTVANPMAFKEEFTGGQVLAQQSGAGTVLTFTFASAVQLVVVDSSGDGLVSRIDPFGGTPSESLGIPCRHEVPVYLPITATVVKVYAPAGAAVNCWGMRR
jgi:hypothetical protein